MDILSVTTLWTPFDSVTLPPGTAGEFDILGVTTLWTPFGPVTAPVTSGAVDLFEAVYAVLDADTDLAALFGRSGWLWRDLAPPGDPLPRAVWADVGGTSDHEVTADAAHDPLVSWTSVHQYQLSVYTTSRATSRALARAVAAAIERAALAAQLSYQEATLLYLRRDGQGLDQLDPDKSPAGLDVWAHLLQLRAIAGESN